MAYQVLARKYRPQAFDKVVGQDHITRTLENAVASKRIAQGYLFSGMRGVGKTTMARILAKALNCEQGPAPSPCNTCGNCIEITQGHSMDVIEIDGASNTSVDDIRELRQNVLYAPARTRYKIYIIDEVHMLSKSAFNALLKTLEEPPNHVIFVFATTETHKVPITIQSRCQCFQFHRIPLPKIVDHLLDIAEKEGFNLDQEPARLIGIASEGSMRDAQSLFDQVLSFCGTSITLEGTKIVLGVIDQEILDECTLSLIEQDAEKALNLIDRLYSKGVELVEFCKGLQTHLRNLLMVKILKDPKSIISLSDEETAKLKSIAAGIEEDRLLAYVEHMNKIDDEIRRSTHPKILLELALVKMTRIQPLRDFKEILTQIEALEERLQPNLKQPGQNKKKRDDTPNEPPSDQYGQSSNASQMTLRWEEVVAHANKVNPLVGSILEHGFLEKIENQRVIIGFKKKIHFHMAEEKKDKIRRILENFMHKDLKVDFSLTNGKASPHQTLTEKKEEQRIKKQEQLHKENVQNHVVQEALKIFNGKVLEVRDFGTESHGR
jgi:DNA polymerase-3 subunit gamma/tau